jgi:dsRNA-specific ribonuclease
VEVDASKQDLSERLGEWVGVFEAMTLHAAHQALPAGDTRQPSGVSRAHPPSPEDEFHRLRATLVASITAAGGEPVGEVFSLKPVLSTGSAAEVDAGYAPYHQRYLDLQRQMGLRIEALRAHVRQVLVKTSPQLAQLASFDAVMGQMFGDREKKLLSSVPVLLERRFEHLRKTGRQHVFGKEMQELLLAELEVRLQPVAGLVEAFSKEVKKEA